MSSNEYNVRRLKTVSSVSCASIVETDCRRDYAILTSSINLTAFQDDRNFRLTTAWVLLLNNTVL